METTAELPRRGRYFPAAVCRRQSARCRAGLQPIETRVDAAGRSTRSQAPKAYRARRGRIVWDRLQPTAGDLAVVRSELDPRPRADFAGGFKTPGRPQGVQP